MGVRPGILSVCGLCALGWLSALPGQAVVDSPMVNRIPVTQGFYQSDMVALQNVSQHLSRQEYDQALALLHQTVEHQPTNLLALYNLASTQLDLAKATVRPQEQTQWLDQAETSFLRVQSLNPELLQVYLKLGKIAQMRGEYTTAAAHYQQGLEIDPNCAALHYNLGGLYDRAEQVPQAIAAYEKAVALDPNFTFAYNNLGLLYERQGRTADAERMYLEALKRDPGYSFARLNLGTLYVDTQRPDLARKTYQDALARDPQNPWALLYLGNLLVRDGAYAAAVPMFSASIAANPGHAPAYYMLAVALAKLERSDEAVQALIRYLSLDPQGAYSADAQKLVLSLNLKKAGLEAQTGSR